MEAKLPSMSPSALSAVKGLNNFPLPYTIDPKDLQLTNEILHSIRQKMHECTEDTWNDSSPEPEDHFDSVPVKMADNESLNDAHFAQTHISDACSPVYDNSDSAFSFPKFSEEREDFSCIKSGFSPSGNFSLIPTSSHGFDHTLEGTGAGQHGHQLPDADCTGGVMKMSCPGFQPSCDSASSSFEEKVSLKPASHVLPPCRVCGDKASGFHYGANTCEACKGFFRRSLKKDKNEFRCPGDGNCAIQKGRRNNCPLCRYNKCISVGMSKNAIKTGRYTHEKRTQDILEVNTLRGKPRHLYLQPTFSTTDWVSKIKLKKPLSDENKKLLDTVYEPHKLICPIWHKTVVTGHHKILSKQYAESYNKLKKIHNAHSPESEGTQSDNSTSPLVKGEKECLEAIDRITSHLEIAIMAFVRFAKVVPGFIDLPLNDQATLVKTARFEMWMISAHKLIDVDLQVVTGPRGKSYHMEELFDILDPDYVRSLFNFAQSLQELNLTLEEIVLLKCVVLTFSDIKKRDFLMGVVLRKGWNSSDRGVLQESKKVDTIQLRLVNCLEEMISDGARFAKVMNSLIRLRDLTEWNSRISENMVLEWPTLRQNPLLVELLSV